MNFGRFKRKSVHITVGASHTDSLKKLKTRYILRKDAGIMAWLFWIILPSEVAQEIMQMNNFWQLSQKLAGISFENLDAFETSKSSLAVPLRRVGFD